MKSLPTITLILLSVFCPNRIHSQNKLDAYMDHLYAHKKMMGSVAISINDSIIYKKAIGYANVATQKTNDVATTFRVGSITKTYTAVMILKAIEEQRLTLDTRLSTFYPEIKNAGKITIEQLLKHRSGIFNFTEIPGEGQWEHDFHTEKEFIDFFIHEKSNFEPGTKYEYSNTNYALLGFILQKVYAQTYAEILAEKIAKPLHLQNTYYTFLTDTAKNEALSYNIQDRYIRNEVVHFSNDPGSGGIVSNPAEINKFLFALFNGKLIAKESLTIMLPKENDEYGMGIKKLPFKNPVGYRHTGRVENYISDYWFFTDENIGIVSLANAVNINTDQVLDTMLLYLYKQEPKQLNFNAISDLGEKEFGRIKGTYSLHETDDTVTISSDGENAILQDSRAGQMYVPLTYKGKNSFEYADIHLRFIPKKKQMILVQGNVKVVYTKK